MIWPPMVGGGLPPPNTQADRGVGGEAVEEPASRSALFIRTLIDFTFLRGPAIPSNGLISTGFWRFFGFFLRNEHGVTKHFAFPYANLCAFQVCNTNEPTLGKNNVHI